MQGGRTHTLKGHIVWTGNISSLNYIHSLSLCLSMEHTHVNNQDRKSFKYTKDHNKAIVCKTAVLQKPQPPEPETPTRTER